MTWAYLLLILSFQVPNQQQVDRQQQQLERQQQQIDALQQQVRGVSSELDRTRDVLQRELRPACSAEARWQPGNLNITNFQTPVLANLFSLVSTPADSCLPAEIRITATYFDPADQFVCSGILLVGQGGVSQNTLFEFRPYELEFFGKWLDNATWEQSTTHRLICYDREGIEVRYPGGAAKTLRIYATVYPQRGGLSTSEITLSLPRPPPRP